LLFVVYTLGATEAYQLLKIPILVQHYFKHKEQNKHINLIDFLKEHYPEKIVVDDDFAQDMQLPFKTQQLNTINLDIVATPATFIASPIQAAVLSDACKVFFEKSKYTFLLDNAIFQPPKIV
jgi:hypothetical protein